MSRLRAAIGSAIFLVVAPGLVAGLVPWLITGWDQGSVTPPWLVAIGALLIAAGGGVLLYAFGQFAASLGTPAPIAPTAELVSRGLYRYVRNPMYLAVLAVIAGQALVLGRPALLLYGAAVAAAFAAFVRWYEEPVLTRRYGAEYEAYLREVPGWWPALGGRSKRPEG